jgi:hypothetical protein
VEKLILIDTKQIQKLQEELQEKRECGVIHFSVGEIPEFNRRRPDKIIANGYSALHISILEEAYWKTIDVIEAESILTQLFQFDLAYDAEIMPAAEAKMFAREILDHFAKTSRYLTYPIGAFGGVVAIIDGDQIGLVTVFDED